jgi:hypothetical protein
MSKKVGKDCKVALGANSVLGMGAWSIAGLTVEQFDASEFGDEWMQKMFGMKDGGTISFNGFFNPEDVTGQEVLAQAHLYNSELTNLRLYINNTSYFEPCQTTGYFSPTLTTGAPTVLSHVVITNHEVSADKSGLMPASFSGMMGAGCMVLV